MNCNINNCTFDQIDTDPSGGALGYRLKFATFDGCYVDVNDLKYPNYDLFYATVNSFFVNGKIVDNTGSNNFNLTNSESLVFSNS